MYILVGLRNTTINKIRAQGPGPDWCNQAWGGVYGWDSRPVDGGEGGLWGAVLGFVDHMRRYSTQALVSSNLKSLISI